MIRYSTTWSVLSAAVLLTLIIAVPAPAQQREWTRLTFDRPVRLSAVTLPAGVYTFERVAKFGIPIVNIIDAQGHLVSSSPTKPIRRRTTGATIVLAESVSGCAPAIASWYPGNGRDGYEFSPLPSTTVLREQPRLGDETVVDAAAAEGAPTPREGAGLQPAC